MIDSRNEIGLATEAEKRAIGALMREPEKVMKLNEEVNLSQNDFCDGVLRELWILVHDRAEQGQAVDLLTIESDCFGTLIYSQEKSDKMNILTEAAMNPANNASSFEENAQKVKTASLERKAAREIPSKLSGETSELYDWARDFVKQFEDLQKDTDLIGRAYELTFNANEAPPKDESCLFLGSDHPVAARGNLTAIQGKQKSGKSAVVSSILGATLRGKFVANGDVFNFNWIGDCGGAVIHVDTEQSPEDWHNLVCRSLKRSGLHDQSDRLRSFPLVTFSRSERVKVLEGILEREHDRLGSVDAVLIDGIADLCKSPNDEEESLELVSRVHALSHQYNCAIFTVLHENPSSDNGKTRGHLGSELSRKAFANLRVDKDPETLVSTIYGTDMRKRDLPKQEGFCFGWDDTMMMHVFQGRHAGLKAAEREREAISKAREEWEPIFDLIGSQRENTGVPAITTKEAVDAEWEISGKGKKTKPDTMKKRMQKAESLGVLRKTDNTHWTLNQAGKAGS